MTTMTPQGCSTNGCANAAAFTTRSKPAWCLTCIDALLHKGGLAPAEPFTTPGAWRLTTCLTCGVQAHYRLEYTEQKNAIGEKTCRACYWAGWSATRPPRPWTVFDARMLDLLREPTSTQRLQQVTPPALREFLAAEWDSLRDLLSRLGEHGFDLVAVTARIGKDPVVARCRVCQKICVARMKDIGGCTCSRNTRSSNPASPRAGRVLLADSQSPALAWWDHERNFESALRTVTLRAPRSCQWVCPQCRLRFTAKVNDMATHPSCPDCAARESKQRREDYARWQVTPVAAVPELAAAWADEDDARQVMVASNGRLRRFRCPQGHHPRLDPVTFLYSGCPHCRGAQTSQSNKRWLAETLPEIAAQWHPTRNGRHTPQNVVWDSQRTVWWQADCCGHVWQETVRDRDKYTRVRCPACRTILGSLAWHDPGLAAEWSPANPVSAWQVRPHTATDFVPEWICATNPAHRWRAPLSSRSTGAECPDCREGGKSRVELDHHAAAVEVFGGARSGVTVREKAFTSRRSWTTDISVEFGGHAIVIEYDGAYWHAAPAKMLVDERKSLDLLAAGYVVVRLREDDLPSLPIDHERYREVRVYSTAPRPQAVLAEIRDWLSGLTPG